MADLPFGAGGPKAAFFLPDGDASGTTIEGMAFSPYDPDGYPNDGVSFPVFCRNVDAVTVRNIRSDRSVQGVTLTSSTNSVVINNTFYGVTTWNASGGGIGVTTGGTASGITIESNKINLVELFEPAGFSPVGISVIGAPSGSYAGSSNDVVIKENRIDVLATVGVGTQGVEIGTHAGFLPAQCPAHTGIVVESNDLCVLDPDLALVYREGVDEVTESFNKLCKPKAGKAMPPSDIFSMSYF